jgi:hypothetical protein
MTRRQVQRDGIEVRIRSRPSLNLFQDTPGAMPALRKWHKLHKSSLSMEKQQALGYSMLPLLPNNHYG